MTYQVGVFLENKPGKLERVTRILAAGKINIRAITIADSGDFGVLKLLVDDPKKACGLLAEGGLAAALREVVAVEMPDRPGGLDGVARIIAEHRINIEDAYGFVLQRGEKAVFVFQVKEPEEVKKIFSREGIPLVEEQTLYSL